MAKAGASLAASLAAVIAPVSNLDIGQSQLPLYDLDQLEPDPRNFYDLSGIDELASNILLVGLQQPLRVRKLDLDPTRLVIVSGHRRHAALQKLVAEGHEAFRRVPCVVEQDAVSPAMQELRLIYANAATRVLSGPALDRQALRIERLLYDLKEEGYDFPGRMRDHVAEACQVSASKLARLRVIRENLVPELHRGFEAEKLNESCAYTLAKQPPEVQRLVLQYRGQKEMQHWSEYTTSQDAETVAKITTRKCKQEGGVCSNQKAMLDKVFADGYVYHPCDRHCCEKCDLLTRCKAACPLLADKIKALKDDARAQSRQSKQEQEAKEAPKLAKIQAIWTRFAYAREQARKSVQATFRALDRYYCKNYEEKWLETEQGTAKLTVDTELPFRPGFRLPAADGLCAAADLLHCSVDFLLCRTDDPCGSGEAAPWQQNTDYPSGKHLVALFPLPGAPRLMHQLVYSWSGKLYFSESCTHPVNMEPVAWCLQPDIPQDLLP